jgi:hypothetical protein
MNIQQMRHAVRLYSSEWVPLSVNKANRRKWLASVAMLGDKWLFAKPVQKQVMQ